MRVQLALLPHLRKHRHEVSDDSIKSGSLFDPSCFCRSFQSSFICKCPDGMFLSADEHTCEPADQCTVNNGGCSHTCEADHNRVVCSCRSGFEIDLNNVTQCNDVDECHGSANT
jgi:Coagulation Factor Xa inhibitory site